MARKKRVVVQRVIGSITASNLDLSRAFPDYSIEDFKLDVVGGSKSLDVEIGEGVTSADLELTIDGATTLTVGVEDPEKRLMRSDTLSRWVWGENYLNEGAWIRKGRAVDARVDDLNLRLAKLAKGRTRLTLTFEDRDVAYLRRHTGARKAARDTVTRAEFVQMLAREVKANDGIDFFCPELHKRQPIESTSQRATAADRKKDGGKGIASKSKLYIRDASGKRYLASTSQVRLMEAVLDVADQLNAGPKATLALVMACMVESEFKNLKYGDRDSEGILQIRVKMHGARVANSPERSAHAFLTKGFAVSYGAIELARKEPSLSAGKVAQRIQGSAFPRRYDQVRREAQAIVDAYNGGGGSASGEDSRYEFSRGKNENSWDAMGRLAEEVAWQRFMRQGRLWYVSEEYLFAQRAQFTAREGENGVDWIDWDVDLMARDQIAEVRIDARADQWAAWPGMVVVVEGEGVADGRWLVSSIRRDLLDTSGACEITLRKPIPAALEPAEDDVPSEGSSAASGGTDNKAEKAYSASNTISGQARAYLYGGGHGVKLSSIGPKDPLDCSSSTSLALKRAGLFSGETAWVSGDFASKWGKPGKGKYLTVWANAEHVFIEFTLPGKRGKRFDTSPHGSGGSGPRIRFTGRSTAGFTPRHIPGL